MQPQRSPEAWLWARRLEDWEPTPETPAGRPHLKPQVGEHLEQRLAAPPTGPKPGTRLPRDSVPGRPRLPQRLKPRAAGSGPKHRASGSAGCAHQAQGPLDVRFPSTKLLASVLTPRRLNPLPARQRPKPRRLDRVGWLRAQGTNSVTNPKQLDSPAARARVPSQSGWIG